MLELQNINTNTDIELDIRLFGSGFHINGRQEKVFIISADIYCNR
jgi:hypothetical protein